MGLSEHKNIAVVIGINRYQDTLIPSLLGAENDAHEMYRTLRDPNISNFLISETHFLVGSKATASRIRNAISDVLWKPESNDTVIFYFSGHGFIDPYGDVYLASYDTSLNEPLVNGIKIRELKEFVSKSMNKVQCMEL